MENKKSLKRNYWIDILKIIACFCVIVNHTGLVLLEYTNYKNIPVLVYSIMFSICKIGAPIFIMVTGYLLLRKKTNGLLRYIGDWHTHISGDASPSQQDLKTFSETQPSEVVFLMTILSPLKTRNHLIIKEKK